MSEIGRTVIFFGIALIVVGLILTAAPKVPFLGKLPGDIFVKKDGFTFYFPIATSILISIFLTILISLFLKK